MINLDNYTFDKNENIKFYISIILIGIVLSFLFFRNIYFSILIIPFSQKIKSVVINEIIDRRKHRFLLEFKDFLFMSSTSIGAGRSMKDAIRESIPGLHEIYGAKSLLLRELKIVYERIEFGNENDVSVLMDFAINSTLDDVMDFVNIYSICKSTGASLVIALNKASSVIIDKMTIEREIRELILRKEREGIIIFLMPLIVILFLNLCAPDYIAPLYENFVGRIIMLAIIASTTLIFRMIRKIVKVEI